MTLQMCKSIKKKDKRMNEKKKTKEKKKNVAKQSTG